jgi:hypothetical protein
MFVLIVSQAEFSQRRSTLESRSGSMKLHAAHPEFPARVLVCAVPFARFGCGLIGGLQEV